MQIKLKKISLNIIFIFLILFSLGVSIFIIITKINEENYSLNEKEDKENKLIEINNYKIKKKEDEVLFIFKLENFKDIKTDLLKESIIISKEKINKNIQIFEYKLNFFIFNPEKFEKRIIKLISNKFFQFNLNVFFEYYDNYKIVNVVIEKIDKPIDKINQFFKISFKNK